MKHVIIGTLFGLLVMLLGGCTSSRGADWEYNSPFEELGLLFQPKKWKGPIVGQSGTIASARVLKNTSTLNSYAQEDFNDWNYSIPNGWSSRGWGDYETEPRGHYMYFGRMIKIPARGTPEYSRYLRRIGK